MSGRTIGWIACWLLPIVVITLMRGMTRDYSAPNYIWPIQMADDQAYAAYSQHPELPMGMTMQAPPEKTIPRGFRPFHYDSSETSRTLAGEELRNPYQPTEASLARGKAVFETFCLVCHGESGAGDGPLIPKYPNPPAFTTEQSVNRKDGEMFHIVTLGWNNMPSYASQVSREDRWQALLYIRQLQNK